MRGLLLQATDALLAGWCGPVVWDGEEAMLFDDGYLVQRDGGKPYPAGYPELPDLRLDLARAECRDRVARVMAEKHKGAVNGCALSSNATLFTHDPNGGALFWPHGGSGGIGHCPALADLDPNDDTRLPDGSRRVDALALLAVAREVLGE